jgi:glycerol-3-phosphate acyltransferase PlsY
MIPGLAEIAPHAMVVPGLWYAVAGVVVAFALGSIPFGLIVARMRGVDIRAHGSGNIGATNVGRVLGLRWFFVVFVLDMLKGLTPVVVFGASTGAMGRVDLPAPLAWAWMGVVVAAVLGHVFSPLVGFRGGKGVATAIGALLGAFPLLAMPAMLAALVWGLVFRSFRYVSLASVSAAAAMPLAVPLWLSLAPRTGAGVPTSHAWASALTISTALAVLVIYRHRSNISRLRAGTEPRATRR